MQFLRLKTKKAFKGFFSFFSEVVQSLSMSKNYKHLSLEQRYKIEALVKAGIKQKLIANQIGVHSSTISRELKRNIAQTGRSAGEYGAANAQRKTAIRHR